MFDGKFYSRQLDNWCISWESADDYRFWCLQEHRSNSRYAAVVMLNPGSLSGAGENLSRDTTLRVLRELFKDTSYNPFVINLFNLATPKPHVLFEQWERRDHPLFAYRALPIGKFSAVMYAYGDYENRNEYQAQITERIMELREILRGVPEIEIPRNPSGTPKHPMSVQMQGLKEQFRQEILKHALANRVAGSN